MLLYKMAGSSGPPVGERHSSPASQNLRAMSILFSTLARVGVVVCGDDDAALLEKCGDTAADRDSKSRAAFPAA